MSGQIRTWYTLASCWDTKQATNTNNNNRVSDQGQGEKRDREGWGWDGKTDRTTNRRKGIHTDEESDTDNSGIDRQ